MTGKKGGSDLTLGSDLERVDAHAIQNSKYEELPELTDEMLGRAACVTFLTNRRRFVDPERGHAVMGLRQRDGLQHTDGEYRCWKDDTRFEHIDGTAYAMRPAPVRRHQEVLLELARNVANALEGHPCRPFIAPFDVRPPQRDEADDEITTVVQPDLK